MSGTGRIMKHIVLLPDKALDKNVASASINLTRKLGRVWQLGGKKEGWGKKFSFKVVFGRLMMEWQPYAAGTLVVFAYKLPFKVLFFKTNECFRVNRNYSLLITVLVTLLFFLMISTCDSRRQKDEPAS